MIKLLGISGKRESGKSTLAKYLQEDHGFKRLSLANPLKEMCKQLYGLKDDQVYGTFKESPTQYRRTDGSFYTPRDILIREGCLKRSIDPDFWCKKLGDSMRLSSFDTSSYVIDDIRFLNEIQYLKEIFPPIKIVRLERSQEAIGKAALDDLSETELDSYKDWDFILLKELNRTPKDLKKFADYLAAHI
jgi:phosphomevalonate kinase